MRESLSGKNLTRKEMGWIEQKSIDDVGTLNRKTTNINDDEDEDEDEDENDTSSSGTLREDRWTGTHKQNTRSKGRRTAVRAVARARWE